jgi:bidirectional [NiFe] hydrogenase diaphorase subunit
MKRPKLPEDPRYKALDRTMRKLGYDRHALIETLHSAQETFGYLEDDAMRFIALSLGLPLSKVYGVATFYSHFTLKPKGEHVCVICTGTACYIKGANKIIDGISKCHKIKDGDTTPDNQLSLLTARCLGSCGLAPLGVFDGRVVGFLDEDKTNEKIEEMLG